MLISAGGSSGGRGLISASGIGSPPSASPPPAMRHAPRPRLPPPASAESSASPPLKGRIVRLEEAAGGRPPKRPPAGFSGGLLPPSPRRPRGRPRRNGGPRRWLRVAARALGAPLPRRRLPGAHPQPRSPRAASAPGAISWAAGSRARPRAFSAERPVPGRGAASCRFQRRHRAAEVNRRRLPQPVSHSPYEDHSMWPAHRRLLY